VKLVSFEPEHASVVAGWVRTPEEAARWASLRALPDAGAFERWHAEPGVRPFVLVEAGRPAGYGEVWEDPGEGEAELARIVVDPRARGRGVGRTLVRLLAREARRAGVAEVWLRVAPDNLPAIACYRAAGFSRADPDEEASFNERQPVGYVWMRQRLASESASR
jgi:ribosomal protein S18 acetylase RimI-like enzyme